MTDYQEPLVFLVGAGPGHPGLVTVRAVECLARADLVLYDKLVPTRLLDYAPESAERVCVMQLAPSHQDRIPRIHAAMIEAARQGKRVVRLKGGDPFIFGRGGEEAEALRQAGVPYEIVPGVTAGLAAGAYAGIPLTHRDHASAVAFITGHENAGKEESLLDWAALARFPGTLVIYMGFARIAQVVRSLLENGKPSETPAAAVQLASTGDQHTVEAPLRDLPAAVLQAGLSAPTILLVGSVVALRSRLAWFEHRPLFGKRVLVTRPRHQAGDLMRRLEELGAIPVLCPVIDIREPDDWLPVDRALAALPQYDWLVFTSANGVHAFFKRLREKGHDLRVLGRIRLACIGPATAAALGQYHLNADLVPSEYRSEKLSAELLPHVRGTRVLLARADRGREVLREELAEAATVEQIAVYTQADLEPNAEALAALRRGEIDFITLTSSNIARGLLQHLEETCRERISSGQVKLVSISPVTSAVITSFGFPVAAEAMEYTTEGVIQALVRVVRHG